jgi:hypothetical protein
MFKYNLLILGCHLNNKNFNEIWENQENRHKLIETINLFSLQCNIPIKLMSNNCYALELTIYFSTHKIASAKHSHLFLVTFPLPDQVQHHTRLDHLCAISDCYED